METESKTEEKSSRLGLKMMQSTESNPYKMMMMVMNPERSFEGGSMFCNGIKSDIYDVSVGVGNGGVGGGGLVRTLQPLNTIKTSGMAGETTMTLRFPFTSAQWAELEQQAMIYKYMMASIPVPTHLLIPLSQSLAASHHSALGRGACFNLRFSSNMDPEPGRCRRTDGKKWRCARDVAPDQKYCERHMHRGRPRSRKHVEAQQELLNNNNNGNNNASNQQTSSLRNTKSPHHFGSTKPSPYSKQSSPCLPLAKPDLKISPFETMVSTSHYNEPRSMGWMMKGEAVPMTSNQQWQQMMQPKQCSGSPVSHQRYEDGLNMNSYTETQQQQSDSCFMFLNPELSSLDDPLGSDQRQTPKGFIDAWSRESNKLTMYPDEKISASTLSLSMSGGEELGLGITDSEVSENGGNGGRNKSQPPSWMNHVSWTTSAPGGPLGEVLQSGSHNGTNGQSSNGGGGLNLMTDGWSISGGDTTTSSPQTTTISSPSGVLQKALASFSDSSGGSSPTFAAAKSEIALQWMSHNK
ncbi:hypothetical protein GIB67_041243 [Kingdonia uniflora]|uniref:Growth-regulating factor n=1 Tax=Kingdonia uniflora TaxID=39325 RepID=A0A7J7LME8_9MAGN|nr:hypothetical protein GIB67_041243 [Kingdonia uniflora]